jgi:hypothetical protein
MSLDFIQTLPYDSITSLVRKAAYGLVTTCILGTAVYAGYRVAAPEKYSNKQYRYPELNDQVSSITKQRIHLKQIDYFSFLLH